MMNDLISKKEAIEDLSSEQQWIPVSYRAPDKSNFYICTMKDKLVKTVWYSVLYGSWEEDVIAWMPLPEPYKGDV